MSTVKRISGSYSIIGTGANTNVMIGNITSSPANLTVSGSISSNGYYYANGSPLSSGIAALIDDPAPTLGAGLNTSIYSITSSTGTTNLVGNLSISGSSAVTGNLTVGGILTDHYYYANGAPYSSGSSGSGSSNLISQLSSSLSISDTGSNGNLTLTLDGNVYLSSSANTFSIGAQTITSSFALVEAIGGPFSIGHNSAGYLLSPSTLYLLVSNSVSYTTDLYYINSSTGVPQLITADVAPHQWGQVATYSPDGNYVYFMDYSTYTLYGYAQNSSTGALSLIGTTPLAAGTNDIKISPDGLFVYITYTSLSNPFTPSIWVYPRSNVTGIIGGQSQNYNGSATLPAGNALYLSVSENGVYVTTQGAANMYEFSRNSSTGAIALAVTHTLTQAAYNGGVGAGVVSRDGLYYYYSEQTTGNIIGYSINPTTGALTALAGSPFATGLSSSGAALTCSPDGTKIYSAPSSTSATIVAINRTISTGALVSSGITHTTVGYSAVPVGVTKDNLHIVTAFNNASSIDVLQTASSVANPLLTAFYGANGEGGQLQVSGTLVVAGTVAATNISGNNITASNSINAVSIIASTNVSAPTLTSTAASGTAPFTVTSTTPVPNLTVNNINTTPSSTNNGYYVAIATNQSGTSTLLTGATLMYNPGTQTLSSPIFTGNLTGYVNGVQLSGTNGTIMHFPTTSANIASTNVGQTFSKTQTALVNALSISANVIAVDMSVGNNFSITLQANNTQSFSNPTNAIAGTSGQIAITQNAFPSTLTFSANWVYANSGTNPTVSTTANAVNLLTYYVVDSNHVWFTLLTNGVA